MPPLPPPPPTTWNRSQIHLSDNNEDPQARKPVRAAITGFGPFHNISVNPSWHCLVPIQHQTLRTSKGEEVLLDCTEVQVAYQAVDLYCADKHERQQNSSSHDRESSSITGASYDFFVHVGVSPMRPSISLEKRARRFGYERLDVTGQAAPWDTDPATGSKRLGFVDPFWNEDSGEGELRTPLEVEELAKQVNRSGQFAWKVGPSTDPGLFLCEYIYYCSMAHAQRQAKQTGRPAKPVLFVHVPMPKDAVEMANLTEIMKTIICAVADTLP